jgi:metal-dependent hydrolase (beta-lactamase superfamily II)
MAGSKREVEELANKVLDYPINQTFTGHCTGTQAFSVLKGVMGDRLPDIKIGSCFEV